MIRTRFFEQEATEKMIKFETHFVGDTTIDFFSSNLREKKLISNATDWITASHLAIHRKLERYLEKPHQINLYFC
jgi:hypothetical protein